MISKKFWKFDDSNLQNFFSFKPLFLLDHFHASGDFASLDVDDVAIWIQEVGRYSAYTISRKS